MAPQIRFVEDQVEILGSLRKFNADAPRYRELAWDLIRRTQYWVWDAKTDSFGPAKFVGFAAMTYDVYERARDGKSTGARFDGFHTRGAIERAVEVPFRPDKGTNMRLTAWAKALVGPLVFDGVDPSKWQYVNLRVDEGSAVDEEGWSLWSDLEKAAIESSPATFGAYQIRAVDERKRKRTIRRCYGDDPEGLLGIGETKNLRKRLGDLLRCMSDKDEAGHMAGWRYAFLEMQKIFPLEQVQFRYHPAASKAAAYDLEGELLHAYVGRHYELPPLNYKFNWSVLSRESKARGIPD